MADAAQDALCTPSMRLDGMVGVVTGAGRGLGRACAIALADAGAEVALVSRTHSELQALAGEIAARGGKARAVPCDILDTEQVRERIEALERIDILVNNAGGNIPEPFVEVSEEHLDRILTLNVRAAFLVAQSAARRMIAGGRGGSVIHMSSQMGHVGAPNRTVYCMTKHAIEGLSKAMAVELAPHRIRVNAIGPTFVLTPMTRPFFERKAFRNDTLGRIPLGHLAELEDIMGAVVFLASPAAAMITGASLTIDGGWTAW
jgi:NAD(P)-dependent dehydrogenase (short-subunit alcohol dehydrogenase family)